MRRTSSCSSRACVYVVRVSTIRQRPSPTARPMVWSKQPYRRAKTPSATSRTTVAIDRYTVGEVGLDSADAGGVRYASSTRTYVRVEEEGTGRDDEALRGPGGGGAG